MSATMPPGGIGPAPHTGTSVPRVELGLTKDQVDNLEPIVERMREVVMDSAGVAGFDCPACKQLVTVYRVTPSKQTLQILLLLFCTYGPTEHFSLRHDGQRLWGARAMPADTWLLLRWRLLEQVMEEVEIEGAVGLDGRPIFREQPVAGEYYVSAYGEKFIRGEVEIPSHALSYDGKLLRLDTTLGLGIQAGVGHEFDLEELQRTDADHRLLVLRSGDPVHRPRRPRTT